MPRTLDAVFLDIGRVLVHVHMDRFFRGLAKATRRPELRSPELVAERVNEGTLAYRFERGQLSPKEFYAEAKEQLDLDQSFGAFCRSFNDIFSPMPGMARLVERFRRARTTLVLVSNTNALHYPFLVRHYPMIRQVKKAALSFELDSMKPEPAIYRRALELAGSPDPRRVLFIDDLPQNVAGARKLGIRALRFEGAPRLRAALERKR